jgi:hypothetical protein
LDGAILRTVWRSCLAGAGDAEELGFGARPAAQLDVFPLQPRGFQRAPDHQHQPVGLEGLLDVLVGAALDGRDRRLDVAVAGEHDDRQIRMLLLDEAQDLQPVELRSLQPDVEQDQRGPARLDGGQRR